jgi:hypothetical protein
MKKSPLGSGERFDNLVSALKKKKGVRDEPALAAYIGKRKFGRKRFQALAAKGK